QAGIRVLHKRVGGAFDGLVDVGVLEGHFALVGTGRRRSLRLRLQPPCGGSKVVHPAELLALGQDVRDCHRPGGFQARPPEGVRQLHGSERGGSYGVVVHGACLVHAFSPERTIPSMKYFCPMKYSVTQGVTATVHAAMMAFQSTPKP